METQATPRSSPDAIPVHIDVTLDVCGGKPRVFGTRIRVQDIVIWHERLNLSADEIVTRYPQLSLSSVYAALAYYYDHRNEIDLQMSHAQAVIDELRQQFPSKLPARPIS